MTQAREPPHSLIALADRPAGDVAQAIRRLSDADLLRLRALASLRARGLPNGVTWSDLLNEAVLRALDGSRRWSPEVPLVAFLAGVMRSVCSEHWRQCRREVGVLQSLHEDQGSAAPLLAATPAADPERCVAAAETIAAVDRLFAMDPMALRIVAGLANGLTAEELRRQYGLSHVEYDTVRRRMRRTLLRFGLAGTQR